MSANPFVPTPIASIASKNNESSSDDNRSEKVSIVKLHCDNWTEWKKIFTNFLIGHGNKEVFDENWCINNKDKKIFCKKSTLAWTLLHSSISSDLKPIAEAHDSFALAMVALAAACGENSFIKLRDKLYSLISLVYVLGTSIGTHILMFTSLYTSLKSAMLRLSLSLLIQLWLGFSFPKVSGTTIL